MGATVATGAQRVAAHRQRRRMNLVQFQRVVLSDNDVREIADTSYEDIRSADLAKASEALARFISYTVACSIERRNGITTTPLRVTVTALRYSVGNTARGAAPSAAVRPTRWGKHPAAVDQCDLKLVVLQEDPLLVPACSFRSGFAAVAVPLAAGSVCPPGVTKFVNPAY